MKKIIILSFGLCLINVCMAFSTQTRLNGLGVSNWMVEDDYNIWINPARIVQYNKTAWFEPGVSPAPQPSTQWAGVSGNILNGVGGLFVSRPYASVLNNMGADPSGSDVTALTNFIIPNVLNSQNAGSMSALSPQNKFDLFYGFGNKEKKYFGIMLNFDSNYSHYQNDFMEATPADNDGSVEMEKASYETNLSLGMVFLPGWKTSKEFDIALNLGFPVVKNEYSDSYYLAVQNNFASDKRKLEAISPVSYGATLRNIMKLNDTESLFFLIMTNYANLNNTYTENKDTNADGISEVLNEQDRVQSVTNASLGLALNKQCSQKCFLVIGSEFNLTRTVSNAVTRNKIRDIITEEYDYASEQYSVPLKAGLEYQFSRIFTARAGIRKYIFQWVTTTIDDPDYFTTPNIVSSRIISETTIHQQNAVTLNMGLSAALWDQLFIDTVINYDVLYSGTYLISGVTNRPIAQMSVMYKF